MRLGLRDMPLPPPVRVRGDVPRIVRLASWARVLACYALAMAQGPESFSELAQYSLDRNSIRRLPEPFCRRNMVVVLGKVDAKAPDAPVSIGMLHPEDSSLRLEIADYLQRPIQAVKLN